MEIKKNIFLESEKVWTSRQNKDGGWAITGLEKLRSRSTVQMTAAALASMYACRDAASFSSGRYAYEKNIDDGWKFMDSNLTEEELTSHVYTEFSVQQAGMASGDKFIGGLDWYAIIADKLAQPRTSFADYDSTQWGHIVTPAYELIILSRGRLPLTFNKLDYGAGTGWDFHPRDIARFTEYMDTNFERPMRWQIVSLKDNIRTLLDSPIMMISGEDAMNINEAQWKMLVDYSLSGGTLLFVPVKKGVKFLESVKKSSERIGGDEFQGPGEHLHFVAQGNAHSYGTVVDREYAHDDSLQIFKCLCGSLNRPFDVPRRVRRGNETRLEL